MPYGKVLWKSRGGARRASAAGVIQAAARKRAFTKARGGLKTVKAIQRRPYVPKIIKNTASIAELSKAVLSLQKSKLGQAQSNAETLAWVKDVDYSPHEFNRGHPMAFCTNQFVGGFDDNGVIRRAPMYKSGACDTALRVLQNFSTVTHRAPPVP